MERLQGPINPCFYGEHLDVVECLGSGFMNNNNNTESLKFEEGEEEGDPYSSSLDDKMPFLQMLQSVETTTTPAFFHFTEPNFQTLLRLQQLKKVVPEIMETQIHQALELESCVTTQDIMEELHSPVKSETQQQTTHSKSAPPATSRERRKRKRTRPTKNKEEVESQRMTHIAVERNRRRQMNDHLNALRSLMPTSYIQRGDQASIIGGAIDFVKELEQLLNSLEAQKRMRRAEEGGSDNSASVAGTDITPNTLYASPPKYGGGSEEGNCGRGGEAVTAENRSEAADVEVMVIQNHVNLKIQCWRRGGQLVKAIVALEDLRLTVLHLNITSSQDTVLYSFNLKIEDDCKLGSVDEIAAAVQQIFSMINGS